MSGYRRHRLAVPAAALPLLSAGLLATPASAASTTVQGESFALPASQGQVRADPTAAGGKALILWSNGTATGSARGAATSVQIRARGDQCGGAPQMAVTLDGRQVLTAAVAATAWTDYTAPVALGAGAHQVGVVFSNDVMTASCDRNLYLDQMTFGSTAPTPAPTPTPTPTPKPTPTPSPTPAPAGGSLAVQSEAMSLPAGSGQTFSDDTASGGQGMLIWSNDSASTTATLPATTTVTLRARGDQCAGAPQAVVSVDGRVVQTATVAATAWTDYAAATAIAAGSHQISVAFSNDYLDSSCDRNLYVDKVTFASVGPAPTPTPTPTATPKPTPTPTPTPKPTPTPTPTPAPSGTLSFDPNLAGSGLSRYASVVSPGDISVVNDPILGAGRKVMKMTVNNGDTGGVTENNRAQVETPQQYGAGSDIYIGFSMLFPTDFPDLPPWFSSSDPSWLTLSQVYGPPWAGSAPYSIDMNGPGSALEFGDWTDPAGNVTRGIWYDFVVHEKLSTSASSSVAELWISKGQGWVKADVPQGRTPTLSAANNGGANYHKLAVYYRANQWAQPITVYNTGQKIGSTFDIVAGHSYG